MPLSLIITLICFSVFLIILTTHYLKKGRIPEKYSLLWYGFALIILFVGLFPKIFNFISLKLGFEVMSNLIIGIIIGLLIIFNMVLSIMVAAQKKKTTLLIQEVSILKSKLNGDF